MFIHLSSSALVLPSSCLTDTSVTVCPSCPGHILNNLTFDLRLPMDTMWQLFDLPQYVVSVIWCLVSCWSCLFWLFNSSIIFQKVQVIALIVPVTQKLLQSISKMEYRLLFNVSPIYACVAHPFLISSCLPDVLVCYLCAPLVADPVLVPYWDK